VVIKILSGVMGRRLFCYLVTVTSFNPEDGENKYIPKDNASYQNTRRRIP
jgi:hypothetical protein